MTLRLKWGKKRLVKVIAKSSKKDFAITLGNRLPTLLSSQKKMKIIVICADYHRREGKRNYN